MTYLAVPIAAKNPLEAKEQIAVAVKGGAEMLEVRADFLEELTAESAKQVFVGAQKTGLPVIATCRDEKEGGAVNWPGTLRLEILLEAVKGGVDFIDFEFANFQKAENAEKIKLALAKSSGTRLILSAHNFKNKFTDIDKLYGDIKDVFLEAIPKIIYTANHINDCFDAFDLLREKSGDAIVFCMGAAGLISRILAKKLDSFVTFASIDEQSATAPGQLTLNDFKNLYRYGEIKEDTELYGIIADPVGHSLSPVVHNGCFAEAVLNKLYLPLCVADGKDEFDRFLQNCLSRDWLNFKGFSVTIPHKKSALDFVQKQGGFIEPLAEKIGATNTIIIERQATSNKQRINAYNTDYAGALDAITETLGIDRSGLKGCAVAVVGAGGVGRAIVAGLTDAGAEVKIYNRTVKKAQALAVEFSCEFAPLDELESLHADILINCTSIGMSPNVSASPVPRECLKADMVVFDTVYNPLETRLLKKAKLAGAKTINGAEMFIGQALAQFRFFTGKGANAELMKKIVYDCLGSR